MKFRPCIDLHSGKVKQIVGGTLRDDGNEAAENFVSELTAAHYAEMYRADGLTGGHVGGGTAANAVEWLDAGASHVIVTSSVFEGGELSEARLDALVAPSARPPCST
ncbi:1-(5-phosphoribosyl)-5-[(5-phosphoribosylamino)methylideneamino]imidazole-4-carboxamide isomerase [Aureococcus anophagefferens]|nr:1-(5-phosphoribosyl)-5-[(5-phosphoribosylamino)methylideneamino]imidazole-4-carboxamide isomerase [Aureococcus anophagefferens]